MDAQQLEVLNRVAPRYPQLARNAHVGGTVRFRTLIGKDGSIKELKLIDGHPLLIAAAAEAVGQWRYKPMMRDGRPVEVVTEIDVKFTLTQ
jgi:protein TonB